MRQFEYLTKSFEKLDERFPVDVDEVAVRFDLWLNEFGAQGWEAIDLRPVKGFIGVTFKREKQD